MIYDEVISKHLEGLKVSIQETLRDKGINDTMNASESLEVKENQLLGSQHIYYLDYGRAPGKFPPVQVMRNWVMSKLGVPEKEVNSVAYLVGRKISRFGTSIFQDRSKGLELDKMIEEMLEKIYAELPETAYAEAIKFVQS